ncbi:ParB/RepB/Spo0J family partition protein [Porticoccus sp. W117]|uniref:ParB/RepB/Spo0J family partition protein n=1 Tax=Porticoccus sp. W117 TaxID=3054777 RepID=UPI00259409D6|nr:ParB/RepB/Spo0J family partition protein [Porticoccus sp. W117]MDM3870785.1 ParB/RepB/Spo0J family partition protein [Porticoccus sp. W117]
MVKRKLGRGLDALLSPEIAQTVVEQPNVGVNIAVPASGDQLRQLPVEFLQRGKYQPRRDMHPEALEELANSIRAQGIMQPIVVRPIGDNRYEIIAGERRWRAAQMAELAEVPTLIKDVPDETAIAMALIENIQREDLNAIEEAQALIRLQNEFELTQQEVATAVGKSRTAVTNLMRLMTLEEEVRRLLEHGDLEMGHARALLGLKSGQQIEAARSVVAKGMTVRQAEALVRRLQEQGTTQKESRALSPDIVRLQDQLSEQVGVPVMVQHSAKGKGKLVFKYNSLDELDGILAHIK